MSLKYTPSWTATINWGSRCYSTDSAWIDYSTQFIKNGSVVYERLTIVFPKDTLQDMINPEKYIRAKITQDYGTTTKIISIIEMNYSYHVTVEICEGD